MRLDRILAARAVTPTLAALVVVVIALAWGRGPETVSATVLSGGSCPLTSAQELNSIKTFVKMMPVFRHPRCINCHGGIPDPLASPIKADHMGVADLDSTDRVATCENCHMDGWHVGPTWTDKSDVALCSNMKMRFSSAQFIDHVTTDGGHGFIVAAFAGRRGLNPPDPALPAQPPPGRHPQLIQLARDWVTAQGGRFVGDDDCGCVLDKVEVLFHSTLTVVDQRSSSHPITSTITGEGKAVLKLGPELTAPEWDVATGVRGEVVTMTWSGVNISQPAGCVGEVIIQASPATEFKFWLGMSYQSNLRVSLEIIPGVDLHSVLNRCRLPNGKWISSPMNDPISIFSGAWQALHGQGGVAVAAAATAAFDPAKIMAMDPKKLAAMAEAMKNNPNPAAAAAQMTAMMNTLVPGASQLAAAAKSNFRFAIPDNKWCKVEVGTAFLARCDINRTSTGANTIGSSQTITEKTTITIGRPTP